MRTIHYPKLYHTTMLLLLSVLLVGLHPYIMAQAALAEEAHPQQPVASSEPVAPAPYAADVVLIGLQPDAVLPSIAVHPLAQQSGLGSALATVHAQGLVPVFGADSTLPQRQSTQQTSLSQIYRVQLAPGSDVQQAIRSLRAQPELAFAEPDYLAHPTSLPNDPRLAEQWSLNRIAAPAAWERVISPTDVVVAVIDSGLDTTHPDLAQQRWRNPGELAGNRIDDDQNGYIDDLYGWDLVNQRADLSDPAGHGTQVAGLIAATHNNGQGIAGLCPTCRLMALNVAQPSGVANYSDLAAGVAYAALKGARVINLSYGGSSDSATLRAAIAAAAQTAVIVAGAGNENRATPFYPAAYDDFVLAVAGTTITDTKVATSDYGQWVDVSAPGENLLTTLSAGGYGTATGTSLAAACVSGVAGLVISQHPDWSASQVRTQLIQTADPIDLLNPSIAGQIGHGRIHAERALSTPARPLLTNGGYRLNGEPDGRIEPGSSATLSITLVNQWASATNVRATLTTTNTAVSIQQGQAPYGAIASLQQQTNMLPFRLTIAPTVGYNTVISLTLTITADGGYWVEQPLTLRTTPGITTVHGTLTTSTTWTADQIYLVDDHIGIASGVTLTIQPGTEVRFAQHYSFGVRGTLIASGTAEQPIRFTPALSETWGPLTFFDSSSDAQFDATGHYVAGSLLRYVTLFNGSGVVLEQAAPAILATNFEQNSLSAIRGSTDAGFVLRDSTFRENSLELEQSSADLAHPMQITGNTLIRTSLAVTGTALITGNVVRAAPTIGIRTSGMVTLTHNRVLESLGGMAVTGGFVSQNLLANNRGWGLQLGNATNSLSTSITTVTSNTIINNQQGAIIVQGSVASIHQNNLITQPSTYALQLSPQSTAPISASQNWWGTTDVAAIKAAIYDGEDFFGPGFVQVDAPLTDAVADAPAYVKRVRISPDATIGIQTATVELEFSRPMEQQNDPVVTFHTAQRGNWQSYPISATTGAASLITSSANDPQGRLWYTANSQLFWRDATGVHQLPSSNTTCLLAPAIGKDGSIWGTTETGLARYTNTTWITYTHHQYTSTWPCYMSSSELAIANDGSVWYSYSGGSIFLSRFNGTTWTDYTAQQFGLPSQALVSSIGFDHDDVAWFSVRYTTNSNITTYYLVRFDGTTSQIYRVPVALQMPFSSLSSVTIDHEDFKWFIAPTSLLRFDGSQWYSYTLPLSFEASSEIMIDDYNHLWIFAKQYVRDNSPMGNRIVAYGLLRFDGTAWAAYPLPYSDPTYVNRTVVIDHAGDLWCEDKPNSGSSAQVAKLTIGPDYPVVIDATWQNSQVWRASYDFTALIPRGTYSLTVESAIGTDGLPIASSEPTTFTVDYAYQTTSLRPPSAPFVYATGSQSDPSTVTVQWSVSMPLTEVTLLRYAISTAPGATDIVNWTPVTLDATGTSRLITRNGLQLRAAQRYWVTMQVRNSGGLWSPEAYQSFVAGQEQPPSKRVFVPTLIHLGVTE